MRYAYNTRLQKHIHIDRHYRSCWLQGHAAWQSMQTPPGGLVYATPAYSSQKVWSYAAWEKYKSVWYHALSFVCNSTHSNVHYWATPDFALAWLNSAGRSFVLLPHWNAMHSFWKQLFDTTREHACARAEHMRVSTDTIHRMFVTSHAHEALFYEEAADLPMSQIASWSFTGSRTAHTAEQCCDAEIRWVILAW